FLVLCWSGTYAFTSFDIATAYSFVRYRLMEISVVFHKGLAFVLQVGSLVPAYFMILGLVWLFTRTTQYVLSGILLATFTVFAGIYVNFQRRVDEAVGKVLFPERSDADDAFTEFNIAMRGIMDLKTLTEKTMALLSQALS